MLALSLASLEANIRQISYVRSLLITTPDHNPMADNAIADSIEQIDVALLSLRESYDGIRAAMSFGIDT